SVRLFGWSSSDSVICPLRVRLISREHQSERPAVIERMTRRNAVRIQRFEEPRHKTGRRIGEKINRIGCDFLEGFTAIQTRPATPVKVGPEERFPRPSLNAGADFNTASDVGFDAAGRSVELNIQVALAAAAEPVENDVSNAIPGKFQLNQIQVIGAVRSIG